MSENRCPCCGYALELSISCHRAVADQYVCSAAFCWFRCNAEYYEKLCTAMNAQAELEALRSAVMPVVEWYVRSKEKFPVDFVENSPVLEYANQGVVESVTGAQLDVLAKLVREP